MVSSRISFDFLHPPPPARILQFFCNFLRAAVSYAAVLVEVCEEIALLYSKYDVVRWLDGCRVDNVYQRVWRELIKIERNDSRCAANK